MAQVPDNVVTNADIAAWYRAKQALAQAKQTEALLRSRVFHGFFPEPVEGTNKHEINDGTGAVLKATHVIIRTVDEPSLEALQNAIGVEGSNVPKLPLGKLIRWKPEVVIAEYRKLTAEEMHAFDTALIIKPGSPQLEVTIPKRAK